MTLTQSRGWQLTLTHPDTGRSINPDVLDDPEFLPSLNGLVEARIPVRRSQDLLEWPDGTTLSLSLNGTAQPLDELVDIEQQSDRTIVVAEGGVELDNRVRTEYREERRHIAAEDIINNNTPYTADVDDPEFVVNNDVVLQSADTTQEFEDVTEITPTDPIQITNGVLEPTQTGFVFEAESFIEGQGPATSSDYSDGTAEEILIGGDNGSVDFELNHTIPADNVTIAVRYLGENDPPDSVPVVNLLIDNESVGLVSQNTPLSWANVSGLNSDLSAGTHTLTVDVSNDGDISSFVDVVAVIDDRFYSVSNFDNTLNEPSGYLDDPAEYPTVDVSFADAETPFVITEATGNIVIDDTSNEQSVALSPDRGSTFVESDNSDTVTATDLETPQVRLRVTFSAWEPTGPRDQTPRLGYSQQSLDSFEIQANIRQESLLIDQTFDDSVSSVLNQIAGDEYIWSYRLENGTPTIAWTQPGQRTADSDPDIDASVSVSKSVKTWDAVTIKGSAQSASGEEFDGSTSLVDLVRDNIVPGSEAVRGTSNGIQFERGIDYEMLYNPGEIRILDSGDMSAGTTYEINYRYEVEGQFPEDYAGSGRELVETISGVVSDRQAQQLAYTILEIDPGVADPSWSADVLLPRGDELFDPLEALSLEQLELPDAATPLEVREPPQQTPQGIALQLGSRRGLDEALSSLSTQLKSVSRRS